MSREPQDAVHIGGLWIFGFLSVVLAVLKLTVAAYWSWWRVVLPLLTFLGHNALYILTALIWFRWLKDDEEESTSADKHSRVGYNVGALLFFFLFLDNLLRREEGQDWGGFWPLWFLKTSSACELLDLRRVVDRLRAACWTLS
jgi:hypothetical protein